MLQHFNPINQILIFPKIADRKLFFGLFYHPIPLFVIPNFSVIPPFCHTPFFCHTTFLSYPPFLSFCPFLVIPPFSVIPPFCHTPHICHSERLFLCHSEARSAEESPPFTCHSEVASATEESPPFMRPFGLKPSG